MRSNQYYKHFSVSDTPKKTPKNKIFFYYSFILVRFMVDPVPKHEHPGQGSNNTGF